MILIYYYKLLYYFICIINIFYYRAYDLYTSAKLLIESIMMTSTDSNDKRVLHQFAQTFSDQQTVSAK
jgi:hypothetical protein